MDTLQHSDLEKWKYRLQSSKHMNKVIIHNHGVPFYSLFSVRGNFMENLQNNFENV